MEFFLELSELFSEKLGFFSEQFKKKGTLNKVFRFSNVQNLWLCLYLNNHFTPLETQALLIEPLNIVRLGKFIVRQWPSKQEYLYPLYVLIQILMYKNRMITAYTLSLNFN